jgi:hypothetical protein
MGQQDVAGPYILPYTARAGRAPFIIFPILGGVISLLLVPLVLQSLSAWPLFLLLWGAIGLFLFWIGSSKIVLLPDRICYHTAFSRREMRFADIARVEVRAVPGRSGSYFIQIADRFAGKPLRISFRAFRKRDVAIVIDAIATHAPSVILDEGARQLRAGTFP